MRMSQLPEKWTREDLRKKPLWWKVRAWDHLNDRAGLCWMANSSIIWDPATCGLWGQVQTAAGGCSSKISDLLGRMDGGKETQLWWPAAAT